MYHLLNTPIYTIQFYLTCGDLLPPIRVVEPDTFSLGARARDFVEVKSLKQFLWSSADEIKNSYS